MKKTVYSSVPDSKVKDFSFSGGWSILILAAASLLCLGMGAGGAFGPVGQDVDRLFSARIVDESNESFEVHRFTADGSTFLPAYVGAAQLSIDFGKIRTAHFYVQDEQVLVRMILVTDEEMEVYIQPGVRFVGQTDWGKISLRAKDIREISFR